MLAFLAFAVSAHAEAALFVGEPFGVFGHMNPTGHAAVYLSNVCAETPVELRRCRPGERGAVLSRYHRVGGYDWIAIPLVPYLYAVENPADVPASADAASVALLRDSYRRAHLREIVPDGPGGAMPPGDWVQLVGSSYDRTIYGFEIATTPEQDDKLIARLNSRKNKERFNLFYRNCADFARNVINTYYPRAVRRSISADFGITTPKQLAKSLLGYSARHRDLPISRLAIAQVPGAIPRSKPLKGVLEAFVKSKKYVGPLAVFHPIVMGTMGLSYVVQSRLDRRRNYLRNIDRHTQPLDVVAVLESGGGSLTAGRGATPPPASETPAGAELPALEPVAP